MTITAVLGNIGSGKSWRMLQYAIHLADKRQKRLVTNFPLNLDGLWEYCILNNFNDLGNRINEGGILLVNPGYQGLKFILTIPQSIVVIDEGGVFFNSREWQNIPKQLLQDLCQSRKAGVDLIYATQFFEQVDKQLRQLTQFAIHCMGVTMWDDNTRMPKLMLKSYHLFEIQNYKQWLLSSNKNPIKLRFAYAMNSITGPLSINDVRLFKIFESLTKVGSITSKAIEETTYQCDGKYVKVMFPPQIIDTNINSENALIIDENILNEKIGVGILNGTVKNIEDYIHIKENTNNKSGNDKINKINDTSNRKRDKNKIDNAIETIHRVFHVSTGNYPSSEIVDKNRYLKYKFITKLYKKLTTLIISDFDDLLGIMHGKLVKLIYWIVNGRQLKIKSNNNIFKLLLEPKQ